MGAATNNLSHLWVSQSISVNSLATGCCDKRLVSLTWRGSPLAVSFSTACCNPQTDDDGGRIGVLVCDGGNRINKYNTRQFLHSQL